MIPIASLWLPILLSAIGVFLASSVIHMALGYHNSDYAKMPSEADVLDSMRSAGVAMSMAASQGVSSVGCGRERGRRVEGARRPIPSGLRVDFSPPGS